MIFVATGTQFPFDRLVRMVDDLADGLGEEIVAQAMPDKYTPRNFTLQARIPARQFEQYVEQSRVVVAHAGMGIIITAMRLGKPVLVLPRLARLGEHRNEHQTSTANHLQQMGLVTVITDGEELRRHLADTAGIARHELTDRISPELASFLTRQVTEAHE